MTVYYNRATSIVDYSSYFDLDLNDDIESEDY